MENNENYNKAVGERVKAVRKAMGITQRQLLEVLGSRTIETDPIKANYISMIENGKRGLSAKNIQKICAAYGVLPEYLMLSSDYMTDKERREAEFWTLHKANTAEAYFFDMLAFKAGYEVIKNDKWKITDFGAIRDITSCTLKNGDSEIDLSIGDIREFFSDIEEYASWRLRRIIEKKHKEENNNG